MTTSELAITVLEPSEGDFLTQAAIDDESQRTFSEKVYLGCNSTADDWKEVPEAEKAAWEDAHKPEDVESPSEEI